MHNDDDSLSYIQEVSSEEPDENTDTTPSLLLWALAADKKPQEGWFRATGVTLDQLQDFGKSCFKRLKRMKLMRTIGKLVRRSELLTLLKAKVAELLLGAISLADLDKLARVIERLPMGDDEPVSSAEAVAEVEEELSLDEAVAEARRLITMLEQEPPALDADPPEEL